ncbi:unnamed protein product [Peronospora belbahrii]|uniref:Uncharacterized protein n=1 Tax=Peronospora belbahrii TaxID=622444 RepID=A0ABN8D5F0_9STRA|nr:unnamed protein product [Peronospora belbahrii]
MTTSLSWGSISHVKKIALTSDAPVWKSYLAIRSSSSIGVVNASNSSGTVYNNCDVLHFHGRKRAKPLAGRGRAQGASIWMTLATPLTTRHNGRQDGSAVRTCIRHYWEQLSVNERQQILFLDEPELVKQLYKLNLSLLCVGLMQRHLKTSNRTGVTTGDKNLVPLSTSNETNIETSNETNIETSTNASVVHDRIATLPRTRGQVSDMPSEKTYELLEAMEFMDISTGILTVKTELAEDTDRLFTLVGDVLEGFLTSIHVLTESNFNKLFVTESETINTWANYQRLIAMLVEQLILRSYVSHLERKAAQQMEQLLLEMSLEDGKMSTDTTIFYGKKANKKKKKKNLTRHEALPVQMNEKLYIAKSQSKDDDNADRFQTKDDNPTTALSRSEVLAMKQVHEPMLEPKSIPADNNCGFVMPAESIDEATLDVNETIPQVETVTERLSTLNPNALVFQPQHVTPAPAYINARAPSVGKRKLDECIVNIPWGDVDNDLGSAIDHQSIDRDLSYDDVETDNQNDHQQWNRKQRRCEADAELEWQLQQVYASTSSLFGWDFTRQCKLSDARMNHPWSNSMLWRTAPKEVVRYFSPRHDDEYASRFHASHFLSPALSSYYFNPGPPMSFYSPLVHARDMDSSINESFGFQSPMVVSAPEYFNAPYYRHHSSNEVDS